MKAKSTPILMYHSISSNASSSFRPFSLSPEMFGEQMDYLGRKGYTPITMSLLAQAIAGNSESLPEKPVVLTFDDGFADFYTHAFPVLQAHGYVATLFVATAYIGGTGTWLVQEGEANRVMLNWRQLSEVAAAGIECGAHGHRHLELDALPLAAARNEILRCKSILEEHLDDRVLSFAYPFGYYSRGLKSVVSLAGFTSACAVGDTVSSTEDDLFALPRVWISVETDITSFGDKLSCSRPLGIPRLERLAARVYWLLRRSITRMKRSEAICVDE